MATGLQKLLWGTALVALVLDIVGAIGRGFWGAADDCQSWANGHDDTLLQNDWWAKDRGCVARTPAGVEVVHSESLDSKATGGLAVRDLRGRRTAGGGHDRVRQQESHILSAPNS
jgi:hypothetical protein